MIRPCRLRLCGLLVLALMLVATSLGSAWAAQRVGGGLSLPYMMNFYASDAEQMSVAVLESGTRSIKTGVVEKDGKVRTWLGLAQHQHG